MEFQVDDISQDKRTAEQNARLERYYRAARILRAAGIKAKVELFVIIGPTDNPADIVIK